MIYSKIFAIVVTYNGEETIISCLESLKQSQQPVQIIVVDNASTDQTPELEKQFSDIIFLPQQKNLGFGQANNIGMRYALDHGADFFFLLNQDATVNENTIPKLVQIAATHSEFGIISPMQLNGDGSGIDGKVVTYLLKGIESFLFDTFTGRMKELYEIRFVNAAAWLISRRCIETVGGFDDLFFMYGEDDDYVYRANRAGYKVGFVPGATVYHQREINLRQLTRWQNIRRLAGNQSSLVKVRLKKSSRPFIQEVILWRIDHLAQKFALLFKGQWIDLLVLCLSGTMVLFALLKTWQHKKRSLNSPAFWD